MSKLQNIITKYKQDLKQLDPDNQSQLELVMNADWDNINDNLKIIYCGDNPGEIEREQQRYFVGPSGKQLKLFVDTHNNKLEVNSDEYVFFNKTPYHSNNTKSLTKQVDKDNLIHQSIQLTIDCLFDIWKITNMPIVIFGIDKSSYVVRTFKTLLVSNEKYHGLLKSMTILNHPSHNSLFGVIGEYLIENFKKEDEIKNLNYFKLIEDVKIDWLKKK